MCKLTLNAIVTRALMDERFRQALLTGRTDQVMREFPLGEDERWVLENVRATTLDGFVAQLHALMHQDTRSGVVNVPTAAYPSAAYQMAGAM